MVRLLETKSSSRKVLQNRFVTFLSDIADFGSMAFILWIIPALIYLVFMKDIVEMCIDVFWKSSERFVWLLNVMELNWWSDNRSIQLKIKPPTSENMSEDITPKSSSGIAQVSSFHSQSMVCNPQRRVLTSPVSPICRVEVTPRRINLDYEMVQNDVHSPRVLASASKNKWCNWSFEKNMFTGILRNKRPPQNTTVFNPSYFHPQMKSFKKPTVDRLLSESHYKGKKISVSTPSCSCCDNFLTRLRRKFNLIPCVRTRASYKRF